jgi:hypothetical protein
LLELEHILLGVFLVIGITAYKKLRCAFKIAVWLIGCSFLTEITSQITVQYIGTNLQVYAVYTMVFPALLFLLYYYLQNKQIPAVQVALFALMYIFFLINTLYLQYEEPLPTYNQQVYCLFFLGLAFFHYRHIVRQPHTIPLRLNAEFWLNTAVFVYFSSTISVWIAFNLFLKAGIELDALLDWNYYSSLLFYLGLTISLLLDTLDYNHR